MVNARTLLLSLLPVPESIRTTAKRSKLPKLGMSNNPKRIAPWSQWHESTERFKTKLSKPTHCQQCIYGLCSMYLHDPLPHHQQISADPAGVTRRVGAYWCLVSFLDVVWGCLWTSPASPPSIPPLPPHLWSPQSSDASKFFRSAPKYTSRHTQGFQKCPKWGPNRDLKSSHPWKKSKKWNLRKTSLFTILLIGLDIRNQ